MFRENIFGVFLFYFFNQLFCSRMWIVYWRQELYSKLLITMFVFIVANKGATKSIVHLGRIFVFSCQTYILGPIDFLTHKCIIYVFLQIIWATSFQVNHCDEIHIYRKLWKIQTWEFMEGPCAVLWVFWQRDWKRLWGKVRLCIYILLCTGLYWNKYQKLLIDALKMYCI